MKKKILKQRATTVEWYFSGEYPVSICVSLGKTTRWLYKWVSRHTQDDPAWFEAKINHDDRFSVPTAPLRR